MFYSKSDNYVWNRATLPWTEEKIKKEYPCIDENSGRRYKKVPIHAPGVRNGETGKMWKGMMPPKGKHFQYVPSKLDEFDKKGPYVSLMFRPLDKEELASLLKLLYQELSTP